MPSLPFGRLPIPHRIAGFALTAAFLILVPLGLSHHKNLRGEILDPSPEAPSSSLRYADSYFAAGRDDEDSYFVAGRVDEDPAAAPGGSIVDRVRSFFASERREHPGGEVPLPVIHGVAMPAAAAAGPPAADGSPYYVFLQKFPLESSFKMLFHTEVIVCPRATFSGDDSFLTLLDGLSATIAPSRFDTTGAAAAAAATARDQFAPIGEDRWSQQSEPGCVQLGYAGANCGSPCCGSPHLHPNRNYALSSRRAVIGNAMGDLKEVYLYGASGGAGGRGIGGGEAYGAVCHGHMNAVEVGAAPVCVSNWSGRDYNPLTNNCNTYTSAVLKCVYGLSDAKPHLGVSDMRTVTCPSGTSDDGTTLDQCAIPTMVESSSTVLE